MAIAGPSGAGRTTLLKILAGIVPPSGVSEHVLANEQRINARWFQRSPEETLLYAACLRMRGGFQTDVSRAKELLKELGLERVANVRIGSELKGGISGGDKRKIFIGVVVHDQVVLLIDEPTSGVDSSSALHVVLLLKTMAVKQGKTTVLTIHQADYRILELHINVLEFAIEVTEALVMDTEDSETEQSYEQILRNTNLSNVKEPKILYPNGLKEVLVLVPRFFTIISRTSQLFTARIL
ncbi:ATP-binding cassette transporter, putative [Ricinus communis]|uniref:ATP-binding cassette transporter, putative n=1 Tax=Ricinus communis TaxID=3988 RepID=B9SGJ9_RICCO|nr:ATP-binding cassette transporter, putative [Ricinus communis]